MTEPKVVRFSIVLDPGPDDIAVLESDPEGSWVRYSDYEAAITAAEREAYDAGAAHCALAGIKGPDHFKTHDDWRQSR